MSEHPCDMDLRAVSARRALTTFQSMTSSSVFCDRSALFGRFGRRRAIRRSYEHLWPFSTAWSAVATLASLPGAPVASPSRALERFLVGIAAYDRGVPAGKPTDGAHSPPGFESSVVPPLGRGGERYFDDNAWVGLAALEHHRLTGDERALGVSRRAFAFAVSGWSEDTNWTRPGGIRWKEPPSSRSRNTCSNAPTAALGALLYEIAGEEEALRWSTRIYEWVRSALLGPAGLYLDRISPDGSREPTVWSYNQGAMIGAGAVLHRVTGRSDYHEQARSTASASLERFGPPELRRQDPVFNAVYFRNLLLLGLPGAQSAPETTLAGAARDSACEYAEWMWNNERDLRTGLFSRGLSRLNSTAAMLEIHALLGGARPHP